MNRREFLVSGGALASKLADEYGIEFAIHNHGLDPKVGGCPCMYPAAESIMKDIAGLSPRVGLCLDLAYTYAASLTAFVIGGWHPELRGMTVMTPISFTATAIGLSIGTFSFPDTPEERKTVEDFFRKAETPS